jgi:hypothetical protein
MSSAELPAIFGGVLLSTSELVSSQEDGLNDVGKMKNEAWIRECEVKSGALQTCFKSLDMCMGEREVKSWSETELEPVSRALSCEREI